MDQSNEQINYSQWQQQSKNSHFINIQESLENYKKFPSLQQNDQSQKPLQNQNIQSNQSQNDLTPNKNSQQQSSLYNFQENQQIDSNFQPELQKVKTKRIRKGKIQNKQAKNFLINMRVILMQIFERQIKKEQLRKCQQIKEFKNKRYPSKQSYVNIFKCECVKKTLNKVFNQERFLERQIQTRYIDKNKKLVYLKKIDVLRRGFQLQRLPYLS